MFQLGASAGDAAGDVGEGLGDLAAGAIDPIAALAPLAASLLGGIFGGGSSSSNSSTNLNGNVTGGGAGSGISFGPVDVNNNQEGGGGFSLFGGGGSTNNNANTNVNENAASANNSLSITNPFAFPTGPSLPNAGYANGAAPQQSTAGLMPNGLQPVNTGNQALAALGARGGGGQSPLMWSPGQQQAPQGQPAQMQQGNQAPLQGGNMQPAIAQALQPPPQPQGAVAPSETASSSTNPPLDGMRAQQQNAGQPLQGDVSGEAGQGGTGGASGLVPPPPPGTTAEMAPGQPYGAGGPVTAPPPPASDPEAMEQENSAMATLIGPEAKKITDKVDHKKESLRQKIDEQYAQPIADARAMKAHADAQAMKVRDSILQTQTPAQKYQAWQQNFNLAATEIAPMGSPEQQLLDWYRNEINKPGWANAMAQQQRQQPTTWRQDLARRLQAADGGAYRRPVESAQARMAREQAMERYKKAIDQGSKLSDAIQKRAEQLNVTDYDKEMTLKDRVAKEAQSEADKNLHDLMTQKAADLKNGQLDIQREARTELAALKEKLAAMQADRALGHQKEMERQGRTRLSEIAARDKANKENKERGLTDAENKEKRIAGNQADRAPIWKKLSEAKTEESQARTAKIKADIGLSGGPPGTAPKVVKPEVSKAMARIAELRKQGEKDDNKIKMVLRKEGLMQ